MKKKILIGSMLVLTLLLLMPSIPAIQQKTVIDGNRQDMQEKLDTIDLKDIKVLDGIKHPIFYNFVMLFITFRTFQFKNLLLIESLFDLISDEPSEDMPILWIIFISRINFLYATYIFWCLFAMGVNYGFGWNWDIPPPFNN